MTFRIIFIFLILALNPYLLEATKPPQLTPHDTKGKIEEILKAHVSYQHLTPEIIQRSFTNYLEELDPGKTYLTEEETLKWTSPSEDLLNKTLAAILSESFTAYEEMHELFISALIRRNTWEKELENAELPKNVKATEFKDIKWASNEEELKNRILRIKSLQVDASEKLNQESRQQFLQRLSKRRLNREEELKSNSAAERSQVILGYVLKSVSSALDSQTAYFTPAEASQFMIQVQQKLFGIGAQLRDDLNGFAVVRLLDDSPASLPGKLKIGDRIIAVNAIPVVGMDIVEAVEYIRGQQGTPVLLTILRPIGEGDAKSETKLDVEIIRGEVVLKETRIETSYEPYGDGVIALLHLFSFYQDSTTSSTSDLMQAIQDMKKNHNLKGIVLDLRGNAGGLLPQAVTVTGLFISKGVVVSVKDNTGEVQRLRNVEGKKIWDGPLVVLTNKISASASEIVAQTLQDYGRAILVGDAQTYGKGTFQTFTLENAHFGKVNPKGEFKVTRGRYYTVSGKSPQLVGVKTDIVVPGLFSNLDIGEEFAKFPLANDQIPPSFDDDLSDIPQVHRTQVMRLYKFNLQPIMTNYLAYLPILKSNSEKRIAANKNYQNFLKEIAKKNDYLDPTENYGQNDLQLEEGMNIIKDLVFLMDQEVMRDNTHVVGE